MLHALAMVLAITIWIPPPILATQQNGSDDRVGRLAHFITKRQPRAAGYAYWLATRIFDESAIFGFDPAVLTAIAWTESHFRTDVRGSSWEYGIWQVWPYSKPVRKAWDAYRRSGRNWQFPNRPWKQLRFKTWKRVMRDIDASTFMAAYVLRTMIDWCERRHTVKRWGYGRRNHPYRVDRYAHYNSGTRWPTFGYRARLQRRSKIVRRALVRRSPNIEVVAVRQLVSRK